MPHNGEDSMDGPVLIDDYETDFGTTLNEYQEQALRTALGLATGEEGSPLNGAVYAALGLNGEAGEVAEKVKKAWRNGTGLEGQKAENLAFEIGDTFWYLAVLANRIGYDLETIAIMNINKLADRAARQKLASEGDKR